MSPRLSLPRGVRLDHPVPATPRPAPVVESPVITDLKQVLSKTAPGVADQLSRLGELRQVRDIAVRAAAAPPSKIASGLR